MVGQGSVPGVSTMSRIVEIDMRSHVVWQYDIGRASRVTGVQVLKNGNIFFSSGSGEGRPTSRNDWRSLRSQSSRKITWKYVDRRISHNAIRLRNGNALITAAHSEDFSAWPYRALWEKQT